MKPTSLCVVIHRKDAPKFALWEILITPENQTHIINKVNAILQNPKEDALVFAESVDSTVQIIHRLKSSWVFLVFEGESVFSSEIIPRNLEKGYVYLFQVKTNAPHQQSVNHDARLFPATACSSFIRENRLPVASVADEQIANRVFYTEACIIRTTEFLTKEILAEYCQGNINSSDRLFWEGIFYAEKQLFHMSYKTLKRAIDVNNLIKPYKLACINVMAQTLIDRSRFDEAMGWCEKSLSMDACQHAPHLLKHKIYWFQNDRMEAYKELALFLEKSSTKSRANFDYKMAPDEAHFILAELAYYVAPREKLLEHLELFYDYNAGKVSEEVIDKLFIYSVEIEAKTKAAYYFKKLFEFFEMDNFQGDREARILGCLSMFNEKGWAEYATGYWEKLHHQNPQNPKILFGWLNCLLRLDDLEKARKLINKNTEHSVLLNQTLGHLFS